MATIDVTIDAQPGRRLGTEPGRRSGTEPVVKTDRICRSFGPRQVLAGVSLTIGAGEFVALLGRSGSGKSTLLRILAGLDREASGRADVPARRAVAFQDSRLLPWLDLESNVALGLKLAQPRALARQALDEVGLGGRKRDWPKNLSGGEAQRVAMARALVRQPELLLLDEPFGALDALTRIKMHGLLGELCARHGPAVLLVTHDVDEAILLSDRAMVLTDGRISLDLPVDLPYPRWRGQGDVTAMRSRLLRELGVEEGIPATDQVE